MKFVNLVKFWNFSSIYVINCLFNYIYAEGWHNIRSDYRIMQLLCLILTCYVSIVHVLDPFNVHYAKNDVSVFNQELTLLLFAL